MTIDGCAEFESALAELLAEPNGAADERRERLKRHAASCDRCRGALALVDLAELPAESRDPIPDPGPTYWQAFEERLTARIGDATRRASRRTRVAWGLAAIAAAACCALALLVPRRAPGGAEIAAGAAPAEEAGARPSVRSATPAPSPPVDAEPLEEDDLADAAVLGAPSDPFAEGDDAALFPAVDDLSDDQRARLADWLAREEERVRGGSV